MRPWLPVEQDLLLRNNLQSSRNRPWRRSYALHLVLWQLLRSHGADPWTELCWHGKLLTSSLMAGRVLTPEGGPYMLFTYIHNIWWEHATPRSSIIRPVSRVI
jgi:hypothetical protein